MDALALEATAMPRRTTAAVLVYLAAFVHGLTLVSFPAASHVLKGTLGLDDAQYGAIFLPQVLLALIGAVGGSALAGRFGLPRLLSISLLALAASQAALVAAAWAPATATFELVCAGTALLGFGFGLGGAPLNGYAAVLFPERRNAALVGLHSLLGAGLAVGPLVIGALAGGAWMHYPLGLIVLALTLALAAMGVLFPARQPTVSAGTPGPAPTRSGVFWLFAATAVLYAFAEGVFANWAVVFVGEERGLPAAAAGAALSAFWAALVLGRLLVSLLLLRLPAEGPWLALPVAMIVALLLLPGIDSPASAVLRFALAGLACSAFFPLTIALASARFPEAVAQVSSLLIAALMVGVGLGSSLIGALRHLLELEALYRVATAFPAAALVLGLFALRLGRARRQPS